MRLLLVWLGFAAWFAALPLRGEDALQRPLHFETDIRPILKTHCFHCHGEEEKPEGGLDVRLVRFLRQGGESGSALVPGDRSQSLLWQRIEQNEMPPGDQKLSAVERDRIARWIDQGASTLREEPESLARDTFTPEERAHWSFQPLVVVEPPAVADRSRVRTPVDPFLLARLEPAGLAYSPEADRATLLRRLSFDLLGLPPSPELLAQFQADERPDAYERLVDDLLASPHYGERWARHWLDQAGYADSEGYTERDAVRTHAYHYRDYLIRALNDDRPWDELLREQLAGDEMLSGTLDQLAPGDSVKLAATGFLRMVPDGTGEKVADPLAAQNDVVAETLKVVSTSLLGLSVGCAQCHTHRFDPITQVDYFRLRAIFEPALNPAAWRNPTQRLISLWSPEERALAKQIDDETRALIVARLAELNVLAEKIFEQRLSEFPSEEHEALRTARATAVAQQTKEQQALLAKYPRANVTSATTKMHDEAATTAIMTSYQERLDALAARRPPEYFVAALTEKPGVVPTTQRFERGDPRAPREAVEPGELSILDLPGESPLPVDRPDLPSTGRRLAYAERLTNGRHPLVTRVFVNRIWHHHFGRGLVATPGEFGALGERPSHPELLDWLADRFQRDGWRLKSLHRLIVLSSAYRQSSRRSDEQDRIDPENRLLARMSIRRLEAEALRDALLAVNGRLTLKLYGPPVPVTPDESGQIIVGVDTRDTAGRPTGRKVPLFEEEFRRSLYVQVRRSMPLAMLESFDAPLLSPNCQQRNVSTVPPQSLLLLNNEFVVAQAAAFAERVEREAGTDPAARVERAWRLALGCVPTPEQRAAGEQFLVLQASTFAAKPAPAVTSPTAPPPPAGPTPEQQALASFCQALVSSNAFLYVD